MTYSFVILNDELLIRGSLTNDDIRLLKNCAAECDARYIDGTNAIKGTYKQMFLFLSVLSGKVASIELI